MLWLALYFPDLPLQSVQTTANDCATVLHENQRGKAVIVAANPIARQAGIQPGMSLSSSQPLAHPLLSIERQISAELKALNRLAIWAQQFTPSVSLQPPNCLLLEVEASLHLFDGIKNLQHTIADKIALLSYTLYQGVAPTPGGAWLLAKHGDSPAILGQKQLQAKIMTLPIKLLELDHSQHKTFKSLGLKCIADLLRLPRAGLNQRLGPALLLQIDRILGHKPDPREFFKVPETFSSEILLPNTTHETAPLVFVLQRLLQELSGFLIARSRGVQRLQLGLLPAARLTNPSPIQWLDLNLLSPNNDPEYLLKLWQEKLDRYRLLTPVEGILLKAPKLLPITTSHPDLFTPHPQHTEAFAQFVERMQIRLGAGCVQQHSCQNDHRPEKAITAVTYPAMQPTACKAFPLAARPLWLLAQAQPLKATPQGLWLQGSIRLLNGPERIESGWWTSLNIRRDYYLASNSQQQMLWIYQTVNPPQQWFLHGLF